MFVEAKLYGCYSPSIKDDLAYQFWMIHFFFQGISPMCGLLHHYGTYSGCYGQNPWFGICEHYGSFRSSYTSSSCDKNQISKSSLAVVPDSVMALKH